MILLFHLPVVHFSVKFRIDDSKMRDRKMDIGRAYAWKGRQSAPEPFLAAKRLISGPVAYSPVAYSLALSYDGE